MHNKGLVDSNSGLLQSSLQGNVFHYPNLHYFFLQFLKLLSLHLHKLILRYDLMFKFQTRYIKHFTPIRIREQLLRIKESLSLFLLQLNIKSKLDIWRERKQKEKKTREQEGSRSGWKEGRKERKIEDDEEKEGRKEEKRIQKWRAEAMKETRGTE